MCVFWYSKKSPVYNDEAGERMCVSYPKPLVHNETETNHREHRENGDICFFTLLSQCSLWFDKRDNEHGGMTTGMGAQCVFFLLAR